jgi:hypothetical protein
MKEQAVTRGILVQHARRFKPFHACAECCSVKCVNQEVVDYGVEASDASSTCSTLDGQGADDVVVCAGSREAAHGARGADYPDGARSSKAAGD